MEFETRVGRIRYINVLPVYYAMEQGLMPSACTLVKGTPAELNDLLFRGCLDASSISSIEYGRRFRSYLLLPDLSISSTGEVRSVLFFSRVPFGELHGRSVLVTNTSATSTSLIKILLWELFKVRPEYCPGATGNEIPEGFHGLLAIGDEALRLKSAGHYDHVLDLGLAWYELTGLPFVFGVWAVRRSFYETSREITVDLLRALLASKRYGLRSIDEISRLASTLVAMTPDQLTAYYHGLSYDLDDRQKQGLTAFYQYLYSSGEFKEMPELVFA